MDVEITVNVYFERILHRSPTASELETWVSFLESQGDLEEALELFADALLFGAQEVRTVYSLYQLVFGRKPDFDGAVHWITAFRGVQEDYPELTYKQQAVKLIANWVESDEFIANFGSDVSPEFFVSLLYIRILGRPADDEGQAHWEAFLAAGGTKEELIIEFVESLEFKAKTEEKINDMLKAAAALASDTDLDDLDYEILNDNVYEGSLFGNDPVDILTSGDLSIDENSAAGTMVAGSILTAVDLDGGEVHTFELLNDGGGAFALAGTDTPNPYLVVADASLLDFESATAVVIVVRVTDSDGNTFDKEFVVAVGDVNEAPTDLALSNTSITEQDELANGAVIGVLSANDPDGDTLTFSLASSSIVGAVDVVGNQVVVTDNSLLDSEAGVTSVDIVVEVTDGDETIMQNFTIDITPFIDEDPTGILPTTLNVASSLPADTDLVELIAQDPESQPDFHTFSIDTDPTGAFGVDPTGTKLVLLDPTLIGSDVLSGAVNGIVEVVLQIEATDSNGNSAVFPITVSINQNGGTFSFSEFIGEALEGTEADDTFQANAGEGIDGSSPSAGRTANPGDSADGKGGYDRFVLTKPDDDFNDGAAKVTGVELNDIELVVLRNQDATPALVEEPLPILDEVCTPCINMPILAPSAGNPLVYQASQSPNVDKVLFDTSLGPVAIWDLQSEFWTAGDDADINDAGPVVQVHDVTADFVWVDSDIQSKVAGAAVDTLTFEIDELLTNELRITENAAGTSPGGPSSEQVGTILIKATGVPSVIGKINNGWPGGQILQGFNGPGAVAAAAFMPTTHTLAIEVANLTGTTPTAGGAAAANTAAIDFFAGQDDGIGAGLTGLEDVTITGDGDVFLVFDETANDVNSDGDGFPLEIFDSGGSSFLYFEEGGFSGVYVDGGDGYDTVGAYSTDIDGSGFVTNVERLKILNTTESGGETLNFGAFNATLLEIVFAGGVGGDLTLLNLPDDPTATQDQMELVDAFGEFGTAIVFDQCCEPDGDLPADFDLFIDAVGSDARIETIFKVDPAGGTDVTVDTYTTRDVSTLHIQVFDCDLSTDGLFQVRRFQDTSGDLNTLLLTSVSGGDTGDDTTKILYDTTSVPSWTGTSNLSLINGVGDTRNQEFLEFADPGPVASLKIKPIFEAWGNDIGTTRPQATGFSTDPDTIINELIVDEGGVVANLGNADDIITGNRSSDGTVNNEGADFINGNGGDDLIFGAGGNDNISGGFGDDELHGEDGNDFIWGNEGDDLIFGGNGSDFVDAGLEDDIVFGGDGNDTLLGNAGDDVLCGDDGDDSLFGGLGNDLLIGGEGDDFVDAGMSGTDVLVGDYNCDPCYVHVTIPTTDLEECDKFTIGIDTNGDGSADTFFVTEVGTGTALGGGDVLPTADSIAADLEARIQEWIDTIASDPDCWDVSWENGIVTICKVAYEAPVVVATGTDAAIPAVHLSELDGEIADGDGTTNQSGDSFTWDVTYSGGNEVYTFVYDQEEHTSGTNLSAVLSADNVVDTVDELTALAQDIADDFNGVNDIDTGNNAAALALRNAGFSMVVQPNGDIQLIGPDDKTGDTPTVVVSAADGAAFDTPATFGVECITFSGTFQEGDSVVVALDIDLDGLPDEFFEIFVSDNDTDTDFDAEDVAALMLAEINASATTVSAALDGSDPTKLVLTADNAGVAGDFDVLEVNGVEASNIVARTTDLTGEFDAGGEILTITIDDDDSPSISYDEPFAVDLATSLANFVTNHSADILADHGLVVRVNAGNTALEFIDVNQNSADSGLIFAANIVGVGSADVNVVNEKFVPDQVCVWNVDIDPGDILRVTIGGFVLDEPYAASTLNTINNWIATHAATLALLDITVTTPGGGIPIPVVFTDTSPDFFNPFDISVEIAGVMSGSSTFDATASSKNAFVPGAIDEQVVAADGIQDDGQSLDDLGQTDGVPPTDFDLEINVDPKTVAAQDVFVAGARNITAADFGDGFDNDLMPQGDFHGLLDADGLAGDGSNGLDAGVQGVVYVLDFNQGTGGDDLSTYNFNEAINKAANTTANGRWEGQLDDTYGDPDRLQGDKVAFRKLDGTLEEMSGMGTNYAEQQDNSASRDDADANAFSAFNSNGLLRYFVDARSFEQALFDDHNLVWGVDVTQADVDAAIADLADGFDDLGTSTDLIADLDAAKAESWLRVYYNEEGTDAAPEAVMELVGLDRVSQFHYEDIVGSNDITVGEIADPGQFDITTDPFII